MSQQQHDGQKARVTKTANIALDQSIEQLPLNVESRLKSARMEAMSRLESPRHHILSAFIAAISNFKTLSTGLACCLCVALFWLIGTPDQNINTSTIAQTKPQKDIETFILLSTLDETELEIIEDLEFVYWLSENQAEAWPVSLDQTGDIDA